MFRPSRDFRVWSIQCNHAKSCTTDPCCHGNDICARRGVSRLPACMYVCLFVMLLQIDSSLFLDGIEPFQAWHFFVWHSTKRCSSIFDLGPLTPKIDSPKFRHNIVYNSACTAGRTEMFAPTRGFSGMTDSMKPYKMLLGRPLLRWQRIFGKFGLLFHKNRFFFFVCRWKWAIFGPSVVHVAPYKRCSSIFDLGPLTPKIYSPKFALAQNHL